VANPLDRFFEGVLFVVGLAMGSFLNVCISRIPRDESVVRPASHCRECGKAIRWFDNVPLLSFFLLRGRCRDCGARISLRYPAVELLTGVVFAACYAGYGPSWVTLKFCVFGFLLIGLIFMDAETGLLVHEFTYSGIVLGLLFSWIAPGDSSGTSLLLPLFHKQVSSLRWLSLLDAVLGALVGAGFFYVAWALYYLARKRHGLGFGDIALMAMVGAFLGMKLTVLVIVCAPILTLMYIVGLLLWEAVCLVVAKPGGKKAPAEKTGLPPALRQAQGAEAESLELSASPDAEGESVEGQPFLQREIPFGVFLGGCALAAIFVGEAVWRWYLGKL